MKLATFGALVHHAVDGDGAAFLWWASAAAFAAGEWRFFEFYGRKSRQAAESGLKQCEKRVLAMYAGRVLATKLGFARTSWFMNQAGVTAMLSFFVHTLLNSPKRNTTLGGRQRGSDFDEDGQFMDEEEVGQVLQMRENDMSHNRKRLNAPARTLVFSCIFTIIYRWMNEKSKEYGIRVLQPSSRFVEEIPQAGFRAVAKPFLAVLSRVDELHSQVVSFPPLARVALCSVLGVPFSTVALAALNILSLDRPFASGPRSNVHALFIFLGLSLAKFDRWTTPLRARGPMVALSPHDVAFFSLLLSSLYIPH